MTNGLEIFQAVETQAFIEPEATIIEIAGAQLFVQKEKAEEVAHAVKQFLVSGL